MAHDWGGHLSPRNVCSMEVALVLLPTEDVLYLSPWLPTWQVLFTAQGSQVTSYGMARSCREGRRADSEGVAITPAKRKTQGDGFRGHTTKQYQVAL